MASDGEKTPQPPVLINTFSHSEFSADRFSISNIWVWKIDWKEKKKKKQEKDEENFCDIILEITSSELWI